MEPTAQGNGWVRYGTGTFIFTDPGFGITLRLKNARSDDGYTYADVYAYHDPDTGNKPTWLLTRPKVNLTSDRSIPALVKALAARHGFDWASLLEKVCAVLVSQMDQHGVITTLEPLDEAELEQPMLFKRFVPQDLVSGMIAHGGTGKSLLGSMLALAVATGTKVGPFEPLMRGPVLYLDWENQPKLHRRRLTRLCMGLGIPFPNNITHYEARGKLTSAESELVELAHERGAVLSILDSIGFAAGGNLNDNDVATSSVNVLKHLPATKIMIAHVNKASVMSGAAGQMGPTGSAFFWNGPQALYELKASDPEIDESVTLAIYQPKANVGARLKRPMGVRVTFLDPAGPITPEAVEIRGDEVGGEALPLSMKVLDALSSLREMVSAADVAARLGMEDKSGFESVSRTLRELRQKGAVHSFAPEAAGKRGPNAVVKWGLAAREDAYSQPASAFLPVEDSIGLCRCGVEATGYDDKGKGACSEHL